LISGSKDKLIAVWDLKTGKKVLEIGDFKGKLGCLALSPNGGTLAACGDKKDIYLWEFPISEFKGKLKGHEKDVIFIAFDRDGGQLLSIGEDKNAIIWDLNQLKPARMMALNPQTIENSGIDIISAAASPDKSFFAIGVEERVLKKGSKSGPGVSHDMIFEYNIAFYDWESGAEIEILQVPGNSVGYLAISPDKDYIAVDNSTLKKSRFAFMDIERGIMELNYPLDGKVSTLAFSNDGRWMAAGYLVAEDERSYVNLWSMEGVEEYVSTETGKEVISPGPFGPSFRITTESEPLLRSVVPTRVAALYLEGSGVPDELARGLTHSLEAQLSKSSSVTLVERNQIDQVLSELELQASGYTAKQAAEIGNFLDAEYVLIGSVSKLENLLIVTIKFVDVETSEIVGIREVQGEDASLEDLGEMISILGPTLAK
jgi:hypothetical protein